MSENIPPKTTSVRQTHRKSRGGCVQCKNRRVKCGEQKPACDNCTRRDMPCSYELSHRSSRKPSAPGNNDHPFDLFDLEIWNHWTTILRYSLTDDGNGDIAWNQNITQLAFKQTYIAQLILALSALHLSRTDESRRTECIARSNFLQSNAISGMMAVMESGNTSSNPTELYVAACLLVFCSFGKGPQLGQYLVYSAEGEPEWLGLLQGVKSILSEHRHSVFPEYAPTEQEIHLDRINPEEVFTGYSEQFAALRNSIETLEAEDSSFSKYLLSSIRVKHHPDIVINAHHIFGWIFRCNQDYLSSVQTRRPMALVLLAHHCVLLALLKDVWYIEGWVPHLVEAIQRDLHPSYRHWLGWPLRHLDHVHVPTLE
ncbi:hypothetical protein CERZMDRAFT_39270 [Cercospora zeae-maydis SCOH1-5]|uniref:Zn(2)-C6 fungal-type domain-containing protein n=1 Tax=Cercospora zeae-maydis SCOH1-5 TaxID=717836 RepID=A0A6A6FJ58_9PEZI|nr:hypothetical protein CERZMDRAFT_39270 [Cercospora zeae-maydis SCOH1-5]